MKNRLATIGLPSFVALTGVAVIVAWVSHISYRTEAPRLPGADKAPPRKVMKANWPGDFTKFDVPPAEGFTGRWPNFRGADFTNVAEETGLLRGFGPDGPKAAWRIKLGEGYAGAAIWDGRVYVLDYSAEDGADMLRCFRLDDGRELWRRWYRSPTKRQHGMSRTVPAVSEKYVVTLGPKCHVMCVRAETGEFLWGLDLIDKYGTELPQWYAGQCPLIDDGKAIIAPSGTMLMMAVDCETGKVLWETGNPNDWKMTHCSILPITLGGKKIYVYPATGGVVGVNAETGGVEFEYPDWRVKIANVPTPVDLGDGRLFLSGGYKAGSMILKLTEEGGRIVCKDEGRFPPRIFGTEQQTPIFYKGHIYGVLPKGKPEEVPSAMQMTCLDDKAKPLWTSGAGETFGLGAYMIADGMLFVVDDNGVLTLAEASPSGWKKLARAKVLEGHESWGPMALADGRLILRDLTSMICLDIRESAK